MGADIEGLTTMLPSSPSSRRRLAAAALGSAMLAPVVGVVTAGPVGAAVPNRPYVSEIHYDNAGTDVGELVEVHVPPGTSTAGWQIALYNGSNGAQYDLDPVPAVTVPAGGASAAVVVSYPANGIQNGSPDGLALVDPTGAVVELLSYEGTFTVTSGIAAGMTTIDIGVAQIGTEPVGTSLSRRYRPSTDEIEWQGPGAGTPGQPNPPVDEDGVACESDVTHEVGAVQGSGFSTPVAGQDVVVRGVVVGDTTGLGGIYVQDVDGDGDGATSDGIFVAGSATVAPGDLVQVIGRAAESFGETRIDAAVIERCGTADLPAAAALDLPAGGADLERLEGMRVAPADVLTVSEVFDLTRFGELTLSAGGLLVQPTELARPGAGAEAIRDANLRRSVILDDAVAASTSARQRPYLSPDSPVRVGDELTFTDDVVLGFGFGRFRLQPADGTAEGTFAPQNTRPAMPEEVGGDVKVAAFNVLNYFLTFTGDDARGARGPEQHERQAAKIVAAIDALDADVVALMEIEDTASTGYGDGTPDQAVADLVARLNAHVGEERWGYSPLPDELLGIDRDVIRNAIIHRTDRVLPVGEPVGLVDETVWANAREPIAQTFTRDGDAFTVVANHFKSKSPGDPTGDNVDTGDGQGAWNGDRVRQAQSLTAFASTLRSQTADDDVVIIGDLNAYTREDPIVRLEEAGYLDVGSRLDAGRYSYVFDDQSGSLDHAMVTEALWPKITGATHWNINAVESFAYQYTGDAALYDAGPYRASDHDPLIIGIDLDERCFGLAPTAVGTDGDDVLRGTNGRDVIVGLGGDDVIEGGNENDVICGGLGKDRLIGGNGDDRLAGGFDDDVLDGSNGDDDLLGGPGNDRTLRSRGADRTLAGGSDA